MLLSSGNILELQALRCILAISEHASEVILSLKSYLYFRKIVVKNFQVYEEL